MNASTLSSSTLTHTSSGASAGTGAVSFLQSWSASKARCPGRCASTQRVFTRSVAAMASDRSSSNDDKGMQRGV